MKKAPKIRFDGYTEDWEQRKLSAIITEKLSNGVINKFGTEDSNVKHINVINMYTFDKIHIEDLASSSYDEKTIQKCNVEVGDIFMTRSSLKPEGIAEANVLLDSGRYVFDDHLIRMKVDKSKYDPMFVKINLGNRMIKTQFMMRSKTTAFTTIGQEDISECEGKFPCIKEQKKISEYFQNIDHLITLHQKECEKMLDFKKYMLSKMFPQNGAKVPEIRFEDFTEDWEQRKLGEITDILSASRVHKEEWKTEGVPFFRSSDVMAAFKGRSNDKVFISQELFEKLSAISGKPQQGDIFITGGGSIGIPYIVPNNEPLYSKDADLIWVKKSEKHDPFYLYSYFVSPAFREYLLSISHVGTIAHYTIEQVKNTPIFFPHLDEQRKMGQYFKELDHLITLHQRKVETYKKMKQYMLRNMFV